MGTAQVSHTSASPCCLLVDPLVGFQSTLSLEDFPTLGAGKGYSAQSGCAHG